MARKPAGQPGDIVLSNGTTYNPVTQTSGTTWKVSAPQQTQTWVNPDFDWNAWQKQGDTTPTVQQQQPQSGGLSEYEKFLIEQANAQRDANRRNTMDAVKALFDSYGLSSLWGKITEYAQMDYSADTIALMLRQTTEYKQRFPAMDALSKKGRAISESQYIDYERTAASLEQRYGFPPGMILNNVTSLLTEEVSALELNDRAVLASASSLEAPAELKQSLKDYYGIDEGGLAAYYFDPAKALPLLEKQYAVAAIGAEGLKQGFGIEKATSEELQAMGVTQAEARDRMDDAARAMSFTAGRGETASQRDVLTGTFGNEGAAQKIERIAGERVGRFSGGGQFAGNNEGVSGIGSSAG